MAARGDDNGAMTQSQQASMATQQPATVPERMRAAYVRSLGGPENIEVGSLPVPRPGPTDLVVRMLASEVNHVDLFVRSGAYPTHTPFPFVIGRDVVDRKSTRLNSSHVSISYAVFCL